MIYSKRSWDVQKLIVSFSMGREGGREVCMCVYVCVILEGTGRRSFSLFFVGQVSYNESIENIG